MEITTLLPDSWKEEKAKLQDSISDLKKSIKESKKERKSDWKALKAKFSDEIKKIEKSLKELKSNHKK